MDWLLEDGPMMDSCHGKPWKVAIIDDDAEIHKVTKLTLRTFEFEDRRLEFLEAHSGIEAMELLQKHDDIAIILLDVIMENVHTGLELVRFLREELHNHYTRVILRTGQPGTNPEASVIRDYDIDGYWVKTEITSTNLKQLVYTNLRSYRDIISIQRYRKGLTAIIEAMANLAEVDQVGEFASALLQQLAVVLNSSKTEFIMQDSEAFALAKQDAKRWHIMVNEEGVELLERGETSENNEDFVDIAERSLIAKQSLLEPPLYAHYFRSKKGVESVFVLRNSQRLSDFNQDLLQLFSQSAVLMLEHIFERQKST